MLLPMEYFYFFSTLFILLHPLLMPNPGKQIVDALQNQGINHNDKVYVYGNIRFPANMRIQSHNKLDIISMDTTYTLPEISKHFIVFKEKEMNLLELKKLQYI